MNINNCKLFTASSHPKFAQAIANELDLPLGKCSIKRFACGETYINYEETVRSKEIFIIGTIRPQHVHADFFEIFLMADAARRSFAHSVHIILPHFAYSRQDKIHKARESIAMKLCADLLVKSGAEHLITAHLHADQSQAFFDIPVDNLHPQLIFADYFKQKQLKNVVVVSPDAGGAKAAKKFSDLLGVDLAILHKTRPEHNQVEIQEVIGDVHGKTPLIVDDMVDTAGSVCGAKAALIKAGSNDQVYLCATHAILSDPATERLNKANFAEMIFADTLPLSNDLSSLTQLSIAPLFAETIKNVIAGKSVSQLYYG